MLRATLLISASSAVACSASSTTYSCERPRPSGRHHTGSLVFHRSAASTRVSTLNVAVRGNLARDPDETWMLLKPDVALCGEKAPSSAGVSDVPSRSTMHAMIWSPATGSGTPYTAASAMAGGAAGSAPRAQYRVFSVHPQPLPRPSGEPAEPARVA